MRIRNLLTVAALVATVVSCNGEGEGLQEEMPALRDITATLKMENSPKNAFDFASIGKIHYETDAGDEGTVRLEDGFKFTASVSPEAHTIWAVIGYDSGLESALRTQVKTFLSEKDDLRSGIMSAKSNVANVGANDASLTLVPLTSAIVVNLSDSKHFALDERVLEISFVSKSDAKLVWKSDDPLTALRVGPSAAPGKAGMAVLPQAASDAVFTVKTNRHTYTFTKKGVALEAGGITEITLDFADPDKQPVRKVSIIGDSISTFAGYIDPSYSAWYPGSDKNGTATVQSVEKTYWWKVIHEKMQYGELDTNNSYSGTKVVTEGGVKGFVDRAYRCGDPDIIIIHGGTNDKNQSSPIGEYGFDLPMGQLDDMSYRSAYVKLVKMLQNRYDGVQIIVLVGDMLTREYALSNIEIAKHFGLPCVDFTNGGTINNDKTNIPKSSGSHPDAKGHQYMADRIYQVCNDYLP